MVVGQASCLSAAAEKLWEIFSRLVAGHGRLEACPTNQRDSNFEIRVCAGEAGCHAGESPAGRIGLFTTESRVREEAARPNPKARPGLNCPVATTVNLIE
jgi:hypothetical protein